MVSEMGELSLKRLRTDSLAGSVALRIDDKPAQGIQLRAVGGFGGTKGSSYRLRPPVQIPRLLPRPVDFSVGTILSGTEMLRHVLSALKWVRTLHISGTERPLKWVQRRRSALRWVHLYASDELFPRKIRLATRRNCALRR
ncbi:hypothetical protein N792_08135 [Lysobacter concretionis Ko07 = DSM 16239]|uniref:Uncharacterized protein n=1 Tax=Lysobacter concretionis Ko07 = DSM 16239 TaxID=1122185 RepID=A0A0A0EMZ2_9GAMM|nr:hypothetical protein N792_08135 [Lysobacter concretionis Ko07 = DSM 16239]